MSDDKERKLPLPNRAPKLSDVRFGKDCLYLDEMAGCSTPEEVTNFWKALEDPRLNERAEKLSNQINTVILHNIGTKNSKLCNGQLKTQTVFSDPLVSTLTPYGLLRIIEEKDIVLGIKSSYDIFVNKRQCADGSPYITSSSLQDPDEPFIRMSRDEVLELSKTCNPDIYEPYRVILIDTKQVTLPKDKVHFTRKEFPEETLTAGTYLYKNMHENALYEFLRTLSGFEEYLFYNPEIPHAMRENRLLRTTMPEWMDRHFRGLYRYDPYSDYRGFWNITKPFTPDHIDSTEIPKGKVDYSQSAGRVIGRQSSPIPLGGMLTPYGLLTVILKKEYINCTSNEEYIAYINKRDTLHAPFVRKSEEELILLSENISDSDSPYVTFILSESVEDELGLDGEAMLDQFGDIQPAATIVWQLFYKEIELLPILKELLQSGKKNMFCDSRIEKAILEDKLRYAETTYLDTDISRMYSHITTTALFQAENPFMSYTGTWLLDGVPITENYIYASEKQPKNKSN